MGFSTAIKLSKPTRTQTNARSKNRQLKLLLLSAIDEKNKKSLPVFITREEGDEEETKNCFFFFIIIITEKNPHQDISS